MSFSWRYVSFLMSSYFHIFFFYFIIIMKFFRRLFLWNTRYFISNLITNQITSCFSMFLNRSFWSCFYCICCRFFRAIEKFSSFYQCFLAKDKNPYSFTYILSLGSIEYLIFTCNLHLFSFVKFILSSISNGWLFR